MAVAYHEGMVHKIDGIDVPDTDEEIADFMRKVVLELHKNRVTWEKIKVKHGIE